MQIWIELDGKIFRSAESSAFRQPLQVLEQDMSIVCERRDFWSISWSASFFTTAFSCGGRQCFSFDQWLTDGLPGLGSEGAASILNPVGWSSQWRLLMVVCLELPNDRKGQYPLQHVVSIWLLSEISASIDDFWGVTKDPLGSMNLFVSVRGQNFILIFDQSIEKTIFAVLSFSLQSFLSIKASLRFAIGLAEVSDIPHCQDCLGLSVCLQILIFNVNRFGSLKWLH